MSRAGLQLFFHLTDTKVLFFSPFNLFLVYIVRFLRSELAILEHVFEVSVLDKKQTINTTGKDVSKR